MKVSVMFQKKVSGSEPYSSEGYHVSLETEPPPDVAGDRAKLAQYVMALAAEAKARVEEALTNGRVERQERETAPPRMEPGPAPSASPSRRAPGRVIRNGTPQNGRAAPRGDDGLASPKQVNFLRSLGSQNGLSYGQVSALAEETFGKRDLRELTKKEASALIDQLRSEAA